jgi:hypothetical protein
MDGQIRCPRCWKRGPQAAKFCRRCGCALTGIGPLPRAQAAVVARKGGPGALLGLLISGAFILLGLLIFGSLSRTPAPVMNSWPATVNESETATVDPPDPVIVPEQTPRSYDDSDRERMKHAWQDHPESREYHEDYRRR